jgi:hypothetical protein
MDDIFGATIAAIKELSPNLRFTISAKMDDSNSIDWDSFIVEDGQLLPSIIAIEEKRTELLRATPLRKLREARDIKLNDTDWVVTKAFEQNQSISQEWLDYRQALRDITQYYYSLETVIWPQKP